MVNLAISGESHHELGEAKREGMTLVNLPEMISFAISLADSFHFLELHGMWESGHEEDAAFDLKEVRVPQLLLMVRQSQEYVLTYYVLNAYQPAVPLRLIVYQTLPHLLI